LFAHRPVSAHQAFRTGHTRSQPKPPHAVRSRPSWQPWRLARREVPGPRVRRANGLCRQRACVRPSGTDAASGYISAKYDLANSLRRRNVAETQIAVDQLRVAFGRVAVAASSRQLEADHVAVLEVDRGFAAHLARLRRV